MQCSLSNLALTLENPKSIQTYFERVRELSSSGAAFPVDLDDLWPLVYAHRGDAIRALRRTFIEAIDFQTISQNAKREVGATVTHVYQLSVACMEYFIARKVRSVFEVYRKVFHHVVGTAMHVPQTGLIQLINQQTEKIISLERKIDGIKRDRVKFFKAKVVERKQEKDAVAAKRERTELFDLFERYCKVCTFQSAGENLDDVLKALKRHYKLDLTIQRQAVGEHYFDIAIRFGMGHCVSEVIKCHLYKSGSL